MLGLSALGGAAPASAGIGGAAPVPTPRISSVECRVSCAGPGYARVGSTVRLRGRDLAGVTQVTFLGRKAAGDEVSVAPQEVSDRRVLVTVPGDAMAGRVTVATADGVSATPTTTKLRIERIQLHPAGSGPGPGIELGIAGRKVFFDGARQPTLAYVLHDSQPVHATVQVVRVEDGAVIREFDQGVVQPDTEQTVSWDGTANGVEQPPGRYAFSVVAQSGDGTMARSAQVAEGAPQPADSFVLLGYKFPIRGRHDFGSGAAAFGGGRGHQGHDVFARCGTPLVAARGGVVKMKRFQARAGNYLVIDTEQSDVDMAYMHLRDAALVDQGDRVRTGQLIGYVGDTGRAFGCHLHFEEWSGPGWYSGGSPFDPLPDLRAWDELS